MWRVGISVCFAIYMASTWEMSDASCVGNRACSAEKPCTHGFVCLPNRLGTRNECRFCTCGNNTQCYTDSADGLVKCNCTGFPDGGPNCRCPQCQGSCPKGFKRFDRTCTCYYAVLNRLNMKSAKMQCWYKNSYLVKIASQEENDFVLNMLKGVVGTASLSFWIGANDLRMEGDWRWSVDNTRLNDFYTNWWGSNPNDLHSSQECAVMDVNGNYDGGWNDVNCYDYYKPFICEYNP